MRKTCAVTLWTAVMLAVLIGRDQGAVTAQTGAQQPPTARVLVTTTQVKPGMAPEYRAILQNEAVPANKKAGVPWRWVFQGGPLSGQANTYVTVVPVANFALFDGPNPMQRALGMDGAANTPRSSARRSPARTQSCRPLCPTPVFRAIQIPPPPWFAYRPSSYFRQGS